LSLIKDKPRLVFPIENMKITVILCTFNRCLSLARTLESVAASVLPESVACEILVVDNNSTDSTREVVEGFMRSRPGVFRYLFEAHQGKSFALNAGVRGAQGDVLAFLDDDVTVEPTWLENLTAPLHGSEWAGTGGRTLLERPFSPPAWLELYGPCGMGAILAALFDLGDKPCPLDRPPYGANMAYRKNMFEKYGLFRTDLGPSPSRKTPRPNEDTELGRRLMAAGERLLYQPSAVVYHPVEEDRVRKKYFLNWWFDFGRADVREKGSGTPVLGIPRHVLSIPKKIALQLPAYAFAWMLTFDPKKRFLAKCRMWTTAGQIVESRRLAREHRQTAADCDRQELIDRADG
jgi:glycosyltransferase involved in cell wall biosynthesis